jgi:hypothetical protein
MLRKLCGADHEMMRACPRNTGRPGLQHTLRRDENSYFVAGNVVILCSSGELPAERSPPLGIYSYECSQSFLPATSLRFCRNLEAASSNPCGDIHVLRPHEQFPVPGINLPAKVHCRIALACTVFDGTKKMT